MDDLLDLGTRLWVKYPSPEAGWNVAEYFAKRYAIAIGEVEGLRLSTD